MNHNCRKNKTVLRDGALLSGCNQCLSSALSQGGAAAHFREHQRTAYRRELTQPNQGRDFIRAYGIDKARENGYSEEDLRLLS